MYSPWYASWLHKAGPCLGGSSIKAARGGLLTLVQAFGTLLVGGQAALARQGHVERLAWKDSNFHGESGHLARCGLSQPQEEAYVRSLLFLEGGHK
jgi:hypothetical protein